MLLVSQSQWTEYDWNARWGGKFEAIRTQTFHATNHASKTNDYAISINNGRKIVQAIKSGAEKIVFTFTKTYLFALFFRNELTTSSPAVISRDMMRDISKHACLEVKTRVSGSQIWLQERIAEILAGSVPVIFSSLVNLSRNYLYSCLAMYG